MIAKSIFYGASIAVMNGILTYAAARWAFRKSHKIFYGVFFGGMLWKLLTLAALFLCLRRYPVLDIPAALLSLAVLTVILNTIEAGLFYKTEPSPRTYGF